MSNILADGANWTPAGLWDGTKFVFISTGETDAIEYAGTVSAGDVIEFDIAMIAISGYGNPQINVVVNGASAALIPASEWDPMPASYASDPLPAGATVNIEVLAVYGAYGHEMALTPVIPPPPVYESEVFVYAMNRVGSVGAWSRYLFPFPVDQFTIKGDDLYIRSGDDVLRVDPASVTDYTGDPTREAPFDGVVQFQWLDFGQPGVNKQIVGFDMVGQGVPSMQFGYNQSLPDTFTTSFDVPADTVPGQIIPMPLLTPSMSVKITYAGGQAWQFQAMNLYLSNNRMTS